ncbi:MAG: hypothetical protein L0312_12715, partial [Acidobacteria bacterium]|nr:hypothetical protein [Acidobacteriota bacterium]
MAIDVGDLLIRLRAEIGEFRSDLGKAVQVSKTESARLAKEFQKTSRDARDSIDLLSDAVGVRLPRELKKVISESTLLAPVLANAFSIAAAAAFLGIIVHYAPVIREAADELGGFTKEYKALNEEVAKENKRRLSQFSNLDDAQKALELTRDTIEAEKARLPAQEAILALGNKQTDADLKIQGAKREISKIEKRIFDLTQQRVTQQTDLNRLIAAGVPKPLPRGIFPSKEEFEQINKELTSGLKEALPLSTQMREEFERIEDAGRATRDTIEDLLGREPAPPDLSKLGLPAGGGIGDLLGAEAQRNADAMRQELGRLKDEARAVFEETRTPAERFAAGMERLKLLLNTTFEGKPILDAETFRRAVEELNQELQATDRNLQEIRISATAAARSITSGFIEAIVRGGSFREVLAGILQDLGRIILQLAFRPVENFLGGLFESIFGGIFG